MFILAKLKGASFSFNGRACVYLGLAANQRCMFADGEGWLLEVPDPEDGRPVWPKEAQVVALMARGELILRADPLDDPIRRLARQQEPTKSELASRKQKGDPQKPFDRWYTLRALVLAKWDEETCALHKEKIDAWFRDHFDVDDLITTFGKLPSPTTFRTWVRTRGSPGDRRPADAASMRSIAPRRRRIDPVVLQIAKLWALRVHSKPGISVNSMFNKAKSDIKRYNAGEKLEINNFETALQRPKSEVSMCTRRIFTMEVERAKGAQAIGVQWGVQARRQRFGGGGPAQEPTRFLEVVQVDDTPFPIVFVFDPVHRYPVGTPTVTIALDVYTRVILGWDISYETPRYATYMRTMLSTALPKLAPEDHPLAHDLSQLCGRVVGHMLVDNAKHLIGRSAQDAGGDIGHAVRWAGSKQPTHKGHVESCIETLQAMLKEVLDGATWDIPLMREFGYDPAKHAVVTIERFRELFTEVVAAYHTTGHAGLAGRTPLEVWLEQRELHGLDMVRDPDHFQRAIGEVHTVSFRGDGASIDGLRYGSNRTDDRYPLSNEDILHHLALARGEASSTKKRTFDNVKIKIDPTNLGKAWLFDEYLREYVAIPCAMRRYAENLSRSLHEKIRDFAREKGLKFASEHDLASARDRYFRKVAEIVPEAKMAEMRATARLYDSPEGRAYLGNAVELVRVAPSPSGMENVIVHDDRVGTRGDATRVPPRRSERNKPKDRPRDRRDASGTRKESSDPADQHDRQDEAYHALRLDTGWTDGGYR